MHKFHGWSRKMQKVCVCVGGGDRDCRAKGRTGLVLCFVRFKPLPFATLSPFRDGTSSSPREGAEPGERPPRCPLQRTGLACFW